MFELVNCGKKSIQLDLKSEPGREIFYKLTERSDVILEGFRPGVASRLKIGYEDIKKIKPDIVYCSISGFGQDGPYHDKPGHDVNYLALSGYFSIPGQIAIPPSRPGIPIVDLCAGTFGAVSVLAALMVKERTNEGQYIDVAMLDAINAWSSIRAGAYLIKKEPITDDHVIATNDVFETKDGKRVALGIIHEEHFWQNFCKAIGNEALLKESRFSTYKARQENKEELCEILRRIFFKKTGEEWLQLFKNIDVPLTPVNRLEEALSDPQIVHRGLVKKVTHPDLGEINVVGFPAKFSGLSTDIQSLPPRPGEHTQEILRQLGHLEGTIPT